MYLSLILDVRTAGSRLPRQLHALQRLMRAMAGHIELLVADDTGDTRLPRLTQRYGVRLCPCEGTPLGDRFNAAVARSQGDVLVFPMSGSRLSHHWLQLAAERITRQQWDAVVLTLHPVGRLAPLTRLRRRLHSQPSSDVLCVSRLWFERIGGFDPALDLDALPNLLNRLQACQARIEMSSA